MSFSGNVKEELAGQISNARHCQIAECAAILYFSAGAAMEEEEHPVLKPVSYTHLTLPTIA